MSKKNIDELFQERFKDFEAVPDEKVWEAIDASLEKKDSRKIIPIWWKLGGVAVVLAGFLVTLQLSKNEFFQSDIDIHKEYKVSDKNTKPKNSTNHQKLNEIDTSFIKKEKHEDVNIKNLPAYTVEIKENTEENTKKEDLNNLSNTSKSSLLKNNSIVKQTKNSSNSAVKNSNTGTDYAKNEPNKLGDGKTNKTESNLKNSENISTDNLFENDEVVVEENDDKKKSIFDEIAPNEDTETSITEAKINRWSVGSSIAPVYFNSLGEGSSINESFVSNAKSGEINLSYGVTVAYEVNKKLKIRSGIHKAEYGYTTDQISYTSSFVNESIGKLANISYNSSASNIAVSSQLTDVSDKELIVATDATAKSTSYEGGLLQQFGYIEIPFELNYALIDKRFGFDVIGGLSSLFLINNAVYLNSGDQTTEVGKANNINSINFSTNVGFGINYKISEKLFFNAEPLFKYQLNTFSNTSGDFQPFSLGIYSGLNFKF